jgi:parvulin-like peptidyl-prolyl isomerase
MIEEELVRQEAETRGLTVSEEELEEGIGVMLGFDPNAATEPLTGTETITGTANATPTPLPEAQLENLYQQFKTNVLQVTRYPEKDFRAMIEANLLREQLKAELSEDVEQVQDQVETIFFALETEEAAAALRARINEEGEDPTALIEELNNDESDQTSAFNLPWLPLGYIGGQFSPEIERVAFNTPVERASEPVTGVDERFYVIYVSGHEERELSPDLLGQAEEQAYEGWLAEAKQERSEYLAWEEAIIAE